MFGQLSIFPPRVPADIVNAAEKNLVVRDGVAGVLRALGSTFANPTSL